MLIRNVQQSSSIDQLYYFLTIMFNSSIIGLKVLIIDGSLEFEIKMRWNCLLIHRAGLELIEREAHYFCEIIGSHLVVAVQGFLAPWSSSLICSVSIHQNGNH